MDTLFKPYLTEEEKTAYIETVLYSRVYQYVDESEVRKNPLSSTSRNCTLTKPGECTLCSRVDFSISDFLINRKQIRYGKMWRHFSVYFSGGGNPKSPHFAQSSPTLPVRTRPASRQRALTEALRGTGHAG